jgi:hypothetical protein
MPTIKARINISLSKPLRQELLRLARRDEVPQATKAAHLLETALEMEEDRVWDSIAASRDSKKTRFVPHSKAWK